MLKALQPVVIVVAVGILLAVGSVGWSETYLSGYNTTQVIIRPSWAGNEYAWELYNNSDRSLNGTALVWSFKVFNMPSPVSTVAPSGWSFDGSQFVVAEADRYKTPPALAPGKSLTFACTVDPMGAVINRDNIIPGGQMAWSCYVGQVVPNSGSLDGGDGWDSCGSEIGSRYYVHPYQPIPDCSTLGLSAMAGLAFASMAYRKRRYQ